MKKLLPVLFLTLFSCTIFAQKNFWQQEANFTIHVALNDVDHTLEAFESIEYINHSPDTLQFIWFHIWPNAYKNDKTAFSEQLLKEGRTDFYFSTPNQKGYINQLDFKAGGITAAFISDSKNIDIIKLLLPKPLAPGGKTIITTPFKVKLPYNFSRGGHVGHDYQVTQWFPKPAVYDQQGWHAMPYLDQGEFYSEFGNFDVQITAPSAYVVAASGILQDSLTLQELKEKGKHTIDGKTKTWHFKESNIHDFAWFASKDFVVHFDTATLPSKKIVDIFSYYRPKSEGWGESIGFAKDGIKRYSKWIGDYPYSVTTIVQGSKNVNSDGMEYPTISFITSQQRGQELDETIIHEIGHNWFYGALATDERIHPWMDEGMNTYYQKRYEREKYFTGNLKENFLSKKLPENAEETLLLTLAKAKKDQPIETSSTAFTAVNYGLIVYYKTSRWMRKLEEELGREVFDKSLQNYFEQWKFKHPQPQDFKASIENTAGKKLDKTFSLLHTTGEIAYSAKKIKPSFLFNSNDQYNYINVAPAVGYNNYDKAMIGGLIHNFTLPLPSFQYIAGALYGTGSKKVNGFGRAAYNIYKKNYHLTTALSYISYSQNDFITRDNNKLILGLKRWTPSIKLTLFDNDLVSTRRMTFQLKTFLLNEGGLNFKTVYTPADTFDVVTSSNNHSYINRLSVAIADTRILYPYSLQFIADQGKDFIKAGLTAKYYFNYPDGKTGMTARFFAGKFFYLKPVTNMVRFNNDRYFLNMSGPKGNEDYTYSDYFIGRNEFEGWQTQQLMERDGFFKVNTQLLGNKVGKTDDWLMSANFSSGIPDNINPLSILPFRIPFKIFADIGTYAEAWKDNAASGRFIYDAGIQIPLFHSLIDIYIPIIYSKVYSNYYKSTITEKRFLKTIAFTINISKLKVQDFIKELPL